MDEPSACEEWNAADLVEGVITPGSDYRAAYRRGARIVLELEEATGKVAITRAGGAVKVGNVVGLHEAAIASCLRAGLRFTGNIVDVAIGPSGKALRIRLDRPGR